MIPDTVRAVLDAHPLGHLVTINPDGSPQVTVVWVGIEDEELVVGAIGTRQKLRNVQRDPRVAVSFETDRANEIGLREYLVVHGTATIEEGGAPELLQELAKVHLGPEVRFPPMDDPPAGVRLRISVRRVAGVGPWMD